MAATKDAGKAGRSVLLLVIDRTFYGVHRVRDAGEPAFRLRKADGTLYDVSQTRYGRQCDCPDFVFRRDGLDPKGCKHVRALVDAGLLDDAPEARPAGAVPAR